jgi:hypothetical protein
VLPGSVAQLVFLTQPVNGVAATVLSPVRVALLDAYGNQLAASIPVMISLSNNATEATLGGTLTRNAVNGVATFDDLRINAAATGYTLSATTGSLSPVASTPFNIAVGAAVRIQLVGSSSVTAVAGVVPANLPHILVTDAGGNGVPNDSILIRVTPANGEGLLFSGVFTTNAAGIVAFDQIPAQTRAGQYIVTFINAKLSGSPIAVSVTILPGPATKLAFAFVSNSGTAGVPLSLVQVVAQDAFSNTATGATNPVTLSITPGTGATGATLVGTPTQNAVNGVATFSNVAISLPGSGYTLTASAQGLASTTSASITIVPPHLAFTQQPAGGVAGTNIGTVRVSILDATGALVTTATNSVTISIGTNAGEGTLSGTLTKNAVGGVATFTDLSINYPGSGYTLVATSAALTSATSAPFSVTVIPSYSDERRYLLSLRVSVSGGALPSRGASTEERRIF